MLDRYSCIIQCACHKYNATVGISRLLIILLKDVATMDDGYIIRINVLYIMLFFYNNIV